MPICTPTNTFTIPPLTGKVILITGATSGLGKQCLQTYALHSPNGPAKIYLCARNLSKAEATLAEIQAFHLPTPAPQIIPLELDLASLASVEKAARKVRHDAGRLDILMLNAGIMAAPPRLTEDGYEVQFGTNFLGHALLTKILVPLMESTADIEGADVRVVALTSYGHTLAPEGGVVFPALKTTAAELGPYGRYGQSKLASVLWTRRMAREFPRFTVSTVHPGLVGTNLATGATDSNWMVRTAFKVAGMVPGVYASLEKGARNQLWASVAEGVVSGEYYEPVGVGGKGSELAKDDGLAERLWEWTEKELERFVV